MNKVRAMEIASSTVMANVTYYGRPICIESVSNDNETANVHLLNRPNNSREVSLTNLQEL